jgi:hypothetical protein
MPAVLSMGSAIKQVQRGNRTPGESSTNARVVTPLGIGCASLCGTICRALDAAYPSEAPRRWSKVFEYFLHKLVSPNFMKDLLQTLLSVTKDFHHLFALGKSAALKYTYLWIKEVCFVSNELAPMVLTSQQCLKAIKPSKSITQKGHPVPTCHLITGHGRFSR